MKKSDIGRIMKIIYVNIFFFGVCTLLSVFLLYSWFDFRIKIKKKILYKSLFVRLTDHPFYYELFHNVCIFPLFSKIYRYIPRLSGNVLQVGCGTGYFNKYVKKTYTSDIPELYNLDLNLRHLEYGVKKKRFDSYIHASINKVPVEDNFFDTILFVRSFHHIHKLKTALMECSRILKTGGQIIIFDPVIFRHRKVTMDYYQMNSYIDGIIHFYTEKGFKQLVESKIPAGMKIKSVSTFHPIVAINHNVFFLNKDCVMVIEKTGHATQPHAG